MPKAHGYSCNCAKCASRNAAQYAPAHFQQTTMMAMPGYGPPGFYSVYGPQAYGPQFYGPQVNVPQVYGPQVCVPQVYGPQVCVPQVYGPQVCVPQVYGPPMLAPPPIPGWPFTTPSDMAQSMVAPQQGSFPALSAPRRRKQASTADLDHSTSNSEECGESTLSHKRSKYKNKKTQRQSPNAESTGPKRSIRKKKSDKRKKHKKTGGYDSDSNLEATSNTDRETHGWKRRASSSRALVLREASSAAGSPPMLPSVADEFGETTASALVPSSPQSGTKRQVNTRSHTPSLMVQSLRSLPEPVRSFEADAVVHVGDISNGPDKGRPRAGLHGSGRVNIAFSDVSSEEAESLSAKSNVSTGQYPYTTPASAELWAKFARQNQMDRKNKVIEHAFGLVVTPSVANIVTRLQGTNIGSDADKLPIPTSPGDEDNAGQDTSSVHNLVDEGHDNPDQDDHSPEPDPVQLQSASSSDDESASDAGVAILGF